MKSEEDRKKTHLAASLAQVKEQTGKLQRHNHKQAHSDRGHAVHKADRSDVDPVRREEMPSEQAEKETERKTAEKEKSGERRRGSHSNVVSVVPVTVTALSGHSLPTSRPRRQKKNERAPRPRTMHTRSEPAAKQLQECR